jgi:inner membrane protein
MNGRAPRVVAGGAIGLFLADRESRSGQATAWPLVGGLAGSVLTCLPDCLEPALHPNHRQFFHSLIFAGLLMAAFVKLRDWQPEKPESTLWRNVGMLAIGGYLTHLALDATTAKSLPLLGRL